GTDVNRREEAEMTRGMQVLTVAAALLALAVASAASAENCGAGGNAAGAAPLRVQARISIGPARAVSATAGSIWTVTLDTNELLRVDPSANRIVKRLKLGPDGA